MASPLRQRSVPLSAAGLWYGTLRHGGWLLHATQGSKDVLPAARCLTGTVLGPGGFVELMRPIHTPRQAHRLLL